MFGEDENTILIKGECPNGDWCEVFSIPGMYSGERLLELLDTGTFRIHCGLCGTDFPPTQEAILKLRKQLASAQS